MRIAYFGSPAAAVPPLRALHDAGHDIALVVTQPDRRRGRSLDSVEPTPVKHEALERGLEVRTPARSREVVDEVRGLHVELGVVVAFGQLLPPSLLSATEHGFVNVHFSLLPRWRGAAPVERAILAGDRETGVALMAVEETLDTGGIYAEIRTPIADAETAGELRARLVELGTGLLVRKLDNVPGAKPVPQVGEPTYAAKLDADDFHLDPTRASAVALARIVRAGSPTPGAWCTIDGRRLKVLRARPLVEPSARSDGAAPGTITESGVLVCAGGALRLDEVQPEGKRAMPVAAWLAGRRGSVKVDA